MPPADMLWPREGHTWAKHVILRRYLDAWIPIMSTVRRQLVLIDGFAGPGEYTGGEDGSPLIMIDSVLEHSQRKQILSRSTLDYLFVEARADRAANLNERIEKRSSDLATEGCTAVAKHGDFAAVVEPFIKDLGSRRPTPATSMFVDPFGYAPAETRPDLSAEVLGFGHCEVLTFVPTEWMARFLADPALEATLDNLFTGDDWRSIRTTAFHRDSIAALRRLYGAHLHKTADFVRSFTLKGANEYDLFFASNERRGLEKMKEAMWAADPVGGTVYADSTSAGDSILFDEAFAGPAVEALLRTTFKGWFPYEDAETAILETPYLPRHLKKELERLRLAGKMQRLPGSGSGDFDPRSLWCFAPT